MTKKVGIILGTILIIMLLFTNITYGVHDTKGIDLGLKGKSTVRKSGTYTFNNKDVFKIVKYDKNAENDDKTSIYCLKGGPGFGSESYSNNIINYTEYFDIKNPNSIEQPYRNQLPSDTATYNKLVWVLDHIYIPAKTGANAKEESLARESRKKLLDDARVDENSFLRTVTDETEDIIECIQQIAIWHFTNSATHTEYYNPSTDTLELKKDGVNLVDKYNLDLFENEIDQIYSYLVTSAQANYTSTSTNPVEFISQSATVVPEGSNYIIGPYKINRKSNAEYTLTAAITDGTADITNAKILNQNKQEITTGSNISEKINSTVGNNFYISIPVNSNISQVRLSIDAKYYSTHQTMWTVGENGLTLNQPVVIVSRDQDSYTPSHTVQIKNPEFDLALRKFITKINDKAVESRIPNITQESLRKLATGAADFDNGTTATKTHSKTPLLVEKNDKVTYTIRIYNEGEIDGFATTISDYLPNGLELIDQSQSSINKKYNWQSTTENGRTKVYTNYLQNEVISKFIKNPTNGVYSIDYADVEIECRVVKSPTQQDVSLKNVAEIESARDINGNLNDRDSAPGNLTDNQKNNYLPGTSEAGKGYQDDDDYEELIMLGKYFDLSLRKFITAVNDTQITTRIPNVDVTPLIDGRGETTAHYNHTKNPVSVEAGDIVTYTIRVYNEGQVDGYVDEIVDHLPPELEFIVEDDLNAQYGWIIDPSDSTQRTIRTTKLSKENDKDNIIQAFNSNTKKISYKEVKVRCKVKDTAPTLKQITNIAEITKYSNESNLVDRDNVKNVVLPSDENLPDYKKTEIESGKDYIPGQEDDDDFEKVILEKFDLALRKFITGVNKDQVTSRIPQVDTSKYGTLDANGNIITSFEYNHTKDPVRVCQNDIVIYTIRLYNEGTQSGYAAEIKDDIPEGLIFLPDNSINEQYKWKMYDKDGNITDDVNKATHIRSDYLSKENETVKGDNLLKAYDVETMQGPDYRDVKVAFKVSEPNTSDRIIINSAEISKDTDKDGNDVTDIDSTPDKWVDGEDDQDIEKIYVQYFDLALRKWVSQVIVIEDGLEKVKNTGHYAEQDPEPVVRVDVNQKRIDNTVIKFKYNIRVANEGEIPGYASEISDYIPQGLEFNPADNPLWKKVDGKITTDQLKDTLLKPGETATVEVILTWINGEENIGFVMENVAEISKDKNDSDTPDIDSVPNNRKPGEDDIDDAPVIISMVTGKAPTYIAISAGILAIIAGGVILIKKYVI